MTALDEQRMPDASIDQASRAPILEVLDPREHAVMLGTICALALGAAVVTRLAQGWQLWKSVALFLVVMSVPVWMKWRADAERFGATASIAGALVTVQGVHTIEHVVQWSQRHILGLSLRQSNGLLSPANSEWVHFVWNWLVLFAVVYLMSKGMRSIWGWALFAWALGHTLEHTYLFVRFLEVGSQLDGLGVGEVTAQGLAGIFGDGGWLDLNVGPRFPLIRSLPGITTASRVDVHFVWNIGEMSLLVLAVHHLLKPILPGHRSDARQPTPGDAGRP